MTGMLGSYFTVGLRHLLAEKLYSVINIGGLAVGLACTVLIFLFVRYETSFDEGFPNADRIYRVSADVAPGDGRLPFAPADNVAPAAAQLALDFPEAIEAAARIWGVRVRLRRGADTFYEDGLRWADPSFFEIFELEWLAGDPHRALAAPASVVLTESAARRYFGSASPIGETLILENEWPLTVTGVIRDWPRDSHVRATAIASIDTGFKVLGWDYEGNWSFVNFHTYVRLRPGVEIESIESRFADFVARHRRPSDSVTGMVATKLTDVHLSGRSGELTPAASRTELLAFGAVALCILLVACVNFMNLATARAAQRAREVGVRKALGAVRSQLVAQFVGEAVLCAAIAMLLAAALVEVVLPSFNAFANTALELDYLGDARVALALVVFAGAVGLLAGGYPAFYLARFDPARVLKGDAARGGRGARLRQLLVVLQFAVSIVLLIVTAAIHSQTEHARNVDRGFNSEQIVVLSGSAREGLGSGFGPLRERLLAHPEITHVVLGSQQTSGGGVRTIRAEGSNRAGRNFLAKGVDYGFFEAYDIPLVAGRTFSEERGTDGFVLPSTGTPHTTGSYVLNERAARELGWTPAEAVGRWLETEMGTAFSRSVRGPVVGVVKDTYFGSAREPLQPVVYFAAARTWEGTDTVYFRDASVRITGRRVGDTLAYIDAAWRELEPDVPLARGFLSDEFAALYRSEERQARLLSAFAALAVVIACLGLFGLASFTTGRRAKEIGIRKTLGGSVWDVLKLLTADFTKLVLLANVLAWPVAYAVAERWLAGFVDRVSLSPGLFAGSGLLALAIAWLTVAGVGMKAASAKPVGTLRHE